jgi:hypothetical protein
MFDGEINWMSKQQAVAALSTTKYEYMVATLGSKKVVWIQRLFSRIEFEKRDMKISCDSQREILMEKNPYYHSNTKHIDLQYHFMRDIVERNKVLLENVDMLENITNSLTKYVSVVKFSWCIQEMGIVSLVL